MPGTNLYLAKVSTIQEVQEQFSGNFPFLKVNFFRNSENRVKATSHPVIFGPDTQLKQIQPKMADGELEISESMTVAALETAFFGQFGLSVQVLRKSGNLWLDTSRLNTWTLKEQNDHGREISAGHSARTVNIRGTSFRKNLG
ncbi:MAG TPA: hypothetical protein DIC22_10190 [Chitinophagaceae bacterium]|nr:hypothetical protein [Chitinophagaceae bacterium]